MANKYRIYPTRSQGFRLENQFSMCRHLYNWNLEERVNAYKTRGEIISYNQQLNAFPVLKRDQLWLKSVHSQEQKDWFRKLKKTLSKCHYQVKCQQNNFLHKTANELLAKADLIVNEELKIKNMIRRPKLKQDEETGQYLPNGAGTKAGLNKSMPDAGCKKFLSILKYKAQGLGKKNIAVNPAYTSQKYSGCGEIVKKNLSSRMHKCSNCGLILNRDHNAAINILRLGLQPQGSAQESPLRRCVILVG